MISSGVGLVATEALFCGTPVIVSNVGGLKDQVVEGKNGFIFKADEVQSLFTVLERSLALNKIEYEDMVSNSLCSNKGFSLEHIMEKTIAIYNDRW